MATNKDKLIAGAQKLVEKGQFEKAIKEFLKVVESDDSDVRVWLKIGDLYAKTGKKPEATQTYQKVANFYSDQGFYLKAVAVYKQILKLDPRLVEVNQRLAELYQQLGLLSDAMQQYNAVATYYHREGRMREALAALKQSVELDPETVANRIKLAELYSQQNMVRESIDEFSRAAEQLRESQRTDEYMRVAERLLFLAPDNRPVSKELARLYIERADPRRALPKLQICFKADPRDVEVLALLAAAFEALDQRQKAVSVLKELARILGENNDRARRDEVFQKILQLNPGDPDAMSALRGVGGRPSPQALQSTGFMPSVDPGATGAHPLASETFGRPQPVGPEPPTAGNELVPEDEFDEVPSSRQKPATAATSVGAALEGAVGGGSSGPRGDGEAIARILNETDVYVKYRLYAKAIEHLQRVFEYEPRHVEAREKLKALYLTTGKREEAVLELWALVEQTEASRRRRYLREIVEIEPADARAQALLAQGTGSQQAIGSRGAPPMPAARAAAVASSLDEAELLDDDLEELPMEEANSDPIVLPPMQSETHGADDDMIPVVDEHSSRLEVGDADVVMEDRFGLPEDGVPAAAAAAQQQRFREDDHEIRTRFDDQSAARALTSLNDEVDERQLPPVPSLNAAAAAGAAARSESSLEDDLDEADFFIQQSLFDEAKEILDGLLQRFPAHPLALAKLRDVEAQLAAATGNEVLLPPETAAPAATLQMEPVQPAAEERVEIPEEMAAAPPDEMPGSTEAEGGEEGGPRRKFQSSRRGVIERGVTAEDYETHYDLGIAYKEMGLIDDAINEFTLVMKDPAREVQCHLMIGLCFLEKGMQTEAIGHFKKGLYVDGINEREAMSLYFELGQAYERLNDPREALYYYEKVLKRDPRFRNVEKHVNDLRSGTRTAEAAPAKPAAEDLDAAFDAIEER